MTDSIVSIYLTLDDPWKYMIPILKLSLVIFLLVFLYYYIIHKRNAGIQGHKGEIELSLLRNIKFRPSLISLVIRNVGDREVYLDVPVLLFKRWGTKRKFRILAVGLSELYPMHLKPGKASVVNIDLEQFYQYAPKLRKACRLSVLMDEVQGRKFKSRTIRLKWW